MVLLADSGSSKTDWACIVGNKVNWATTPGLNPVTQNADTLSEHLHQIIDQLPHSPEIIYHYGAGCRDAQARTKLFELYKKFFNKSEIIIETDMLGAARAICGGQPGVACILGTGSNAAISDGHRLIKQFPSLGYILGDEGSSSHLAKQLISAFFNEDLEADLLAFIREQLPQLNVEFIFNFYNESKQVQKLSEIAAFMIQNASNQEIQNLIRNSFFEFIDKRITPLVDGAQVSVHTVGSVGFILIDIFNSCLASRGLRAGNCIQKPIEGLVNYHNTYEIH